MRQLECELALLQKPDGSALFQQGWHYNSIYFGKIDFMFFSLFQGRSEIIRNF